MMKAGNQMKEVGLDRAAPRLSQTHEQYHLHKATHKTQRDTGVDSHCSGGIVFASGPAVGG